VELLWDTFGGTTTSAGYKQLDAHVGAIYGDSITVERAKAICEQLAAKGFASTNIVLGVGSFTYEYVTRDTFGFAMKATSATINGVEHALFKKPVTDDGEKFSARGRLAVVNTPIGMQLMDNLINADLVHDNLLQPVWENGKFIRKQSFSDIRKTLRGQVVK
jgi:nicotinamide phosphoribosyltransferase